MVKKHESMPAIKSKNHLLFDFAWLKFELIFMVQSWGYLFPVDIQSNEELGLVMMERNECLGLIETFKWYICHLGYDHTTKSTN